MRSISIEGYNVTVPDWPGLISYFMLSKTLLIISLILISIQSCQYKQPSKEEMTYKSWVGVTDTLLIETIKDYNQENKVDRHTSLLTVIIYHHGLDSSSFEIQQMRSSISRGDGLLIPSVYTMIDSTLVLLFSELDRYIDRKAVKKELGYVMQKYQIKLTEDEGISYHPNIWTATRSHGKVAIQRWSY